MEMSERYATHPRYIMDLLCVADLGVWSTSRMPFCHPGMIRHLAPNEAESYEHGAAMSCIMQMGMDTSPTVAVLIANLYERLALTDPTLQPIAEGFNSFGESSGGGTPRFWDLNATFTEKVRSSLITGVRDDQDNNWRQFY
ncbi:hypothetical protein AB0I82_17155 [Streptomyces sp. NPDC050315]|uniref:hypothetical protein n=1 Tax=Streptomyces sp. NPDC050315 TaxID=3155039 RepID=UPI00342F6700